ncbi:S-layer homology domain-containing protein [Paenibacillus selenitireducens]|nr:S-layer homology domain-containing protein [Paenibacillus selenitireducens]
MRKHWAANAVQEATRLGFVLTGYGDHNFHANQQISREEMAVIIIRANG